MSFVKQANIAHGPQQVNNGVLPGAAPARAENLESEPNKLLEAYGERLDTGETGTAGGRDQAVARVGALHRTAHE